MVDPITIGAVAAGVGLLGAAASDALGTGDHVPTQYVDPINYQYAGGPKARKALVDRLQREQAEADARAAPTLDFSQADQDRAASMQARSQQAQLASQYADMAAGKTPSLAEQQMRAGVAQSQAQASALAASARGGGGNAILAQREAQKQAALGGLSATRDAGMLRAKETQMAMEGQAGLLSSMRQGDLAQGQQSLGRQGLISQNELTTRGQNDARKMGLLGAEMHTYDQQLGANMTKDGRRMEYAQKANELNNQIDEAGRSRKASFFGGMMGAGGSIIGAGLG